MNYTLNQLQIFMKVAETKSVTKAAELLHLTQPAVSIQLKNFQDQFDIPLIEVIGRQVYITEFGKEIAQSAREILDQVQAINGKSQAFKGLLIGTLKIAVVSTGKYVMPYFLTDFLKKNPHVELLMDVSNKTKVLESLTENEVDFALVSIPPDKIAVEKIDLIENRLYLVANAENAAKLQGFEKNMAILDEMPMIYREKGSGTHYSMERFIERKDLVVSKKLELTSNEAVKQAVIAGIGISILPLIGIRNEIENGELKIVPVNGLPLQTTWSLINLSNKKLSPVALAFKRYLEENKQAVIESRFAWCSKY